MTLSVKEYSVYASMARGKTHPPLLYGGLYSVAPTYFAHWQEESAYNWAMVSDENCQKAFDEISANVGVNDAKVNEILKEIFPYILDQAWHVETPTQIFNNLCSRR